MWNRTVRVAEFLETQWELQYERFFLWIPVFLGLGIAIYFSLSFELPLVGGVAPVLAAGIMIWLTRHKNRLRMAGMLFLFIAAGFLAAQTRAALVYTPMLQKELTAVLIEGDINSIETLEEGRGSRILLSNLEIEKLDPNATPVAIRLSVRKDRQLQPGQRIKLLGSLNPPSPPLMPGAFDFQRYMYFHRLGGIGYAFTEPEIIAQRSTGISWPMIENWRNSIDREIEASLPSGQAPIAKALITGRRAGISLDHNETIRNAGLAHILSISGLHISLFATIIFFTSRFLMAFIPDFALRHPIKKYAAILGFGAAFFYTILAGAEVPAQRSLIMVGAVFLAIILDRDPLSPRLLAFAAIIILLLTPESLISISFQMSFAAVMAMIFFYDWQKNRISNWYAQGGMIRKIILYFAGIAMTTVLATLATAPFTGFYFQNLPLYGLIANALAIPLVGYVIMPAAVMAFFLLPFGLSFIPLQVVGWGVTGMIRISEWVAGLPHAVLTFASWPQAGFILLVASIFFLMMWKGPLKGAAIIPLFVSLIMIFNYRQPDILIAPRFDLVALRSQDNFLISSRRKEKFIRENWERMAGFGQGTTQSWPVNGKEDFLSCDDMACRFEHNGSRVAILKKLSVLEEECLWADFILSFEPVNSSPCNIKIIDRMDAYYNGAHAIWLTGKAPVIRTTEEERGKRIWNTWLDKI